MKNNLLIAIAACFLGLTPARASILVSIEPSLVTASPGSTANSLEVLLMNTGPSAVTVGTFLFEVSTANPDIGFTGTTTATTLAPYIFAGDSDFGPNLAISTGQSMLAFDIGASAVSIGAGDSFGLGHALFNVAAGAAPGTFNVVLDPIATSLSDDLGNGIAISSLVNGQIQIAGGTATVPEPATWLTIAFGLLATLALGRRLRYRPDRG